MPSITKLARARSPILFAFAATLICLTLTASPLFDPARAAAREESFGPETVQVFAGDCTTPKTVFYLGDSVCVRVGEFPLHPATAEYYRRINWSAPNLEVAETEVVKTDPEFDRFVIPSSGAFAQPGRWRVQAVDIETNARAYASFIVRHPLTRFGDLRVWKQGPEHVIPGERVKFELTFKNVGPDVSESIQFAEDVPSNATFLALRQTAGPIFDCTTPREGETGRIVCASKGLRLDEEATFEVYYVVSDFVRVGDTCEGLTQVISRTEELHKADNEALYAALVTAPYKEDPPPTEEVDNPRGYVGEKVRMPASEPVNSPSYVGEKYVAPAPEPVNPPDYVGEKYTPPDPEP